MWFTFAAVQAAIVLGWPCQRLNWAWRNVWVTCSIVAYVPVAATPAGSLQNGFTYAEAHNEPAAHAAVSTPWYTPVSQLDGVTNKGVWTPSTSSSPKLCQTAPNTGGTFARNRCRRMLDVYGNLVKLCQTPSKSGAVTNTLSPDFAPSSGHHPHALNVQQLTFFSQWCLTPGPQYPTPTSVCPGLAGWWTVVWNACGFTNAPGVTTAPNGPLYIPNYFTNWWSAGVSFNTPQAICGPLGTPLSGATSWVPRTGTGVSNTFRTTRCRKALDQFGRTASRCTTAGTVGGNSAWERALGPVLGPIAGPSFCSA